MATSTDNLTLYRSRRTNKGYTEDLGDGVALTLMLIPAGEFQMGAPEDEPDSNASERPQHRVKLSPFLMGRTPVTQAQWRVVSGYPQQDIELKPSPSNFKEDNLPVEKVSWHQATEFCKRLSAKTQKNYHLPSEAQWEYACRAGTETAFHFGDKLTAELANYAGEISQTTEVAQYPANDWGLYDMHGNVWEWCQDPWHENYKGAPDDGSAWIEGGEFSTKILRGGSWYLNLRYCRSAYRVRSYADGDDDDLGFRVCCSAPRILQ
jgi:formylglycine-generating enzyme required for sulfatase activity